MQKHSDFAHIDSIAREYAYTHEQVFHLSWSEVMTIIALRKERSYIDATAQSIFRASQSN